MYSKGVAVGAWNPRRGSSRRRVGGRRTPLSHYLSTLTLAALFVMEGLLAACSKAGTPSPHGAPPLRQGTGVAGTSTAIARGRTPPPGQIQSVTSPVARQTVVAASPNASSNDASPRVTLTLLAHDALGGGGFNANVKVLGNYAYVGSWGYGSACPASGVRIVDLGDPAQPHVVATVAQLPGTTQEDTAVRSVHTTAFAGDLLAVGIQRCATAGTGGVALFDVTDPSHPSGLGFFPTGSARGVHELDMIQQGDRVLDLLSVPDSERVQGTGEFQIVDVSDPRNPARLAQWSAGSALGIDVNGGIGCIRQTFDHSARASADGRRVYLSYWDAGVIILDISDPTTPKVAGRIQYAPQEEGETHSVAESEDGHHLLVADEDGIFGSPPHLHFRVQTPVTPRQFYACEALFSRPLDATGTITGALVDAGSGCTAGATRTEVRGNVALVEAGGCTVQQKAATVAAAGATAAVVGVDGEPVSVNGAQRVNIPVVTISTSDAAALRAAAGDGSLPITLPSERHAGGLRIWDISNVSAPRQVAVYQTPDSTRFPPPDDGWYTVHNPLVQGDLAFVSWYSDGVRVLDISDPAAPRELASYVPPAGANPQGKDFPDRTLVWGVALSGDLVLLSDINTGLYVLRAQIQP